MERPALETARLRLRPFVQADAPAVQRLAGERDVAATTRRIPHPYEDGMAEAWIASQAGMFERGEEVNFAITLRSSDELIGAIGLMLNPADEHAELGYWIGKPYWGKGYCTEAARAVLAYAWATLKLHRVHAHCMRRNPASARVMQKIGMKYEGSLRQHFRKWGVFEDVEAYGILREMSVLET